MFVVAEETIGWLVTPQNCPRWPLDGGRLLYLVLLVGCYCTWSQGVSSGSPGNPFIFFWQTVCFRFRKNQRCVNEILDLSAHLIFRFPLKVSWEHLFSSDPLIPRMKLNCPMNGTIWPQTQWRAQYVREVIYVGRSAQRQNRATQLGINLTNTPDNSSSTFCTAAAAPLCLCDKWCIGECRGILECAALLW